MKKTISAIMALCAGMFIVPAAAQTMSDAISFGATSYYGTARTLGMGNAVSAVGGDIGSIAVNPAGSAVAGYSQITITPGVNIATTASSWAPGYYSANQNQVFGGTISSSQTRMSLPNLGVSMRFDTGNSYGVRSWTMAFVSNMTNNFLDRSYAAGRNGADSGNAALTSMAGSFATLASESGMPGNITDYNDAYTSNYPWNYIAAYKGALINYNNDSGTYYGSNEFEETLIDDQGNPYYSYSVPGLLNQNFSRLSTGTRHDLAMNFGFDFNDNFFLGFNLNFPRIRYKYSEAFRENAADPSQFPITPEYISNNVVVRGDPTFFHSATYQYDYSASMFGVNLAAGFIWLPTNGLRIGASVKTPTGYTVNESWGIDIRTNFISNPATMREIDGKEYATTPTCENRYSYRSPWSMNAGVAYTFGTFGMLSVDYELTDYSICRFASADTDIKTDDAFYAVNRLNNLFCGVSHSVRVGVEVRPAPFLMVRGGFGYTSNPERYYFGSDNQPVTAAEYDRYFSYYESGSGVIRDPQYVKAPTTSFSLGLGFVSTGSFFADLAVRRTKYFSQDFVPYATYLDGVVNPTVRSSRKLVDVLFTLGWRF